MTDAGRDRWTAYVRDLADRMGLRDWTIKVRDDHPGDDAHAQVICIPGRKHAGIRFDRDWRDETPETQRQVCIHELIHCHFAALWHEMGRRLKPLDFDTFEMHLEYGVDGVADFIASHMPLPLVFERSLDHADSQGLREEVDQQEHQG